MERQEIYSELQCRGSDTEQIPRHKEINEITARSLTKKLGLS